MIWLLRLTNNLRRYVSRFSPAAQSLAEADIIWSCTCPKTGVVTPVENPCSITSYIGLDQLLRSSICQKKMPHEILHYRSSTSEFRLIKRVEADYSPRPIPHNFHSAYESRARFLIIIKGVTRPVRRVEIAYWNGSIS